MTPTISQTRRFHLYFTIFYFLFYCLYGVLTAGLGISLTYNPLDNLIRLGFFAVPFCVLYWLTYLRPVWLSLLLILPCLYFLGRFYFVFSLAIFFNAYDVFTWNDNGYRSVYEQKLPDDRWFVFFRTPDLGALGGDNVQPAIVRKLIPGFESRTFLIDQNIDYDLKTGGYYTVFDGTRYELPKEVTR